MDKSLVIALIAGFFTLAGTLVGVLIATGFAYWKEQHVSQKERKEFYREKLERAHIAVIEIEDVFDNLHRLVTMRVVHGTPLTNIESLYSRKDREHATVSMLISFYFKEKLGVAFA